MSIVLDPGCPSFNPFDKQQFKEKEHFMSKDFTEMTNCLNYLKDIHDIGVFAARPGMAQMLMNYGYDPVNYFTLILCGESHLNDTLCKPVHEALHQLITVHSTSNIIASL